MDADPELFLNARFLFKRLLLRPPPQGRKAVGQSANDAHDDGSKLVLVLLYLFISQRHHTKSEELKYFYAFCTFLQSTGACLKSQTIVKGDD